MLRLQKLLAAGGHGSRRAIEEWIRAGRITVNGKVAQLGDRGQPGDDIRLDGRPVDTAVAGTGHAVLLYNKALGEVTTRSDPQGRPTVFDRLPPPPQGRWIVVGRLDFMTSGLLLFTTDGELAHRLMHPSAQVEREYLVRSRDVLNPAQLRQLQSGVMLEDGEANFDSVVQTRIEGTHAWYRVVLREGRNREVRRLWQAIGSDVSRLVRIRYGPAQLPRELAAGSWQLLDVAQYAALTAAASTATKMTAAGKPAAAKPPAAPAAAVPESALWQAARTRRRPKR
ncbi:MAG TPA: pseudouridine synthase [Steroidobacteraceae bacterium]|nr:pseudouridine synthase [Steroidobacteraceae bacterium]